MWTPLCASRWKIPYNGVLSASAAGMMTIMVPDLLDPTPEIRSLCTGVVEDLHAVCTLIETAAAAAFDGERGYPTGR